MRSWQEVLNKSEEVYLTKNDRLLKHGGSLSGNQLKWFKDGKCYKLNTLGYEDIAETLVSQLLSYTNIDNDTYIKYHKCTIIEDGIVLGKGCYSYDYINGGYEITIRQILEDQLMSMSSTYDDVRDILLDITGVDFKTYLDNVLCLDAITFNADRHFGNFTLVLNNDKWKGIIFDNGDSCLADTLSNPIGIDYKQACDNILAKPFSIYFTEQIKYATPLLIKYEDFINSVVVEDLETERAVNVIKYGLQKTKGIAWESY